LAIELEGLKRMFFGHNHEGFNPIENVNGLDENIVCLYNFNKAEAIQFKDLLIDTIIDKN
jgi:hypothetical protein